MGSSSEHVCIVPPMSREAIAGKAKTILQLVQKDVLREAQPTDIENIFDNYLPSIGITTGYTDLSGYNAEGYTDATHKTSFVDSALADYQDIITERRFRSTVAHETGHVILHVPISSLYKSFQEKGMGFKRSRKDLKPFEDPEWQAWELSKQLLMPTRPLIYLLDNYHMDVKELAEIYNVNEKFVRTRLRNLGSAYTAI